MDNFVVTFARGFGTGGKAIASQLAKELGIHCYENRILTLASQLSGLDENVFQEVNEKLREEGGFTSFLRGLPRAKGYISRNEKFKSDDRLFEYQSQIINELADKESCVIVGKCADYVLKNRPNVVSIYIEAPRAFCVERTIANMGVTPEVANATIDRTDKFRADYYKYYTHGNYWTNPVNYDLTLNSERVGVENCVKTIEQYLIIKGFIKADMIKPVGEITKNCSSCIELQIFLLLYRYVYPSKALSEANSSPETSSNFMSRSSTVRFFFSSPEILRTTCPLFIMMSLLP